MFLVQFKILTNISIPSQDIYLNTNLIKIVSRPMIRTVPWSGKEECAPGASVKGVLTCLSVNILYFIISIHSIQFLKILI